MTNTTEDFIEKAMKKHGSRYDYSKAVYVSSSNKVTIVCKKHGSFEQSPNDHVNGSGCPQCARENQIKSQTSNISEFIQKANVAHNNKYDYSKCVYVNAKHRVTIICPIHGEFTQAANHHLEGHGCDTCAHEYVKNTFCKLDANEFIERCRINNNNTYDYSKTVYTGVDASIVVTCPTHGDFTANAKNHKDGQSGCPKCKRSIGEECISDNLNTLGIVYKREHTVKTPIYYKGEKIRNSFRVDFMVEKNEKKYFIEYHGEQHFVPIRFGSSIEDSKVRFEKQRIRDAAVRKYCSLNNINLLEIDYKLNKDEYEQTLKKFLGI
jgi:hypothetical protein